MQKVFNLIQQTKFWAWYAKPRSTAISIVFIVVAALLLIIYVPYIQFIKDLFALSVGAMGVLNLAKGDQNA